MLVCIGKRPIIVFSSPKERPTTKTRNNFHIEVILLSGGFCFHEGSVSLPCHGKQHLPPSRLHAGKPGQHHWSVVSSLTSLVTLRKSRNSCCHLPLKMEMTVLNLFVNIRYEWRWRCTPIKTKSLGMAWDRVSFQHSLGRKRCGIACH